MQTVREGAVTIRVPEQPADGAGDVVFFNPTQELNRDLTVAVLRAYREHEGGETYCDAMTASGVRGIRAAADGWEVTCLDVNPDAVALARANFRANDLAGSVRRRDANVDLHRSRYDVVDIDPFGSPIPYLDAAVQGTGRMLCVTATDTAPLCGAHHAAGIRRYSTVPRNTEYHAEMGVRVLLSALVRTAARYDIGVSPLVTHATRHYVRTYVEFHHRATDADAAIDELGYIQHCPECRYRESATGLIPPPRHQCAECDSDQLVTAGPIWLGPIRDRSFVATVRRQLASTMGTHEKADELLGTLQAELNTPTHYDQHRLCKIWGRSAGPMDEFLADLRAAGYSASRTHYGGTTFKTDAHVSAIKAATQ